MVVEKMEVDAPAAGTKRKGNATQGTKKVKAFDISGKTPLGALNELYRGCEFDFTQSTGEDKLPSFKVTSKIEGMEFEGIGPSKSNAKRDLAMKVLQKFKDITPLGPSELTYGGEKPVKSDVKNPLTQNFEITQTTGIIGNLPEIDAEKARANPSLMLHSVWPSADFQFTKNGTGKKSCRFEFEIMNRKFFGEGRSKKDAKLNLAKTVFMCLYNINDFVEEAPVEKDPYAPPKKSKFPLTVLKELTGMEELPITYVEKAGSDGTKVITASLTVKGKKYEAEGANKNQAKTRVAKKAVDVLKPKTPATTNKQGIDTSLHPNWAFPKYFPDVTFTETESLGTDGFPTFTFEAKVEKKSFKVTAPTKKKARMRLTLEIFKVIKKTQPSEWKGIELKQIMENRVVKATS